MAIQYSSHRISGSDIAADCEVLVAYVCRNRRPGSTALAQDRADKYGAEPAPRPLGSEIADLATATISSRLIDGKCIRGADKSSRRLRILAALPAELGAQDQKQILRDWIQGRFPVMPAARMPLLVRGCAGVGKHFHRPVLPRG